MPNSIINSDNGAVSGTSGLKTTGGDDGVLAIQNNGTTNVAVTAAGLVGIGTTSPTQKLHVAGATSTYTRVSSTDVGSGAGTVYANNNSVWTMGAGAISGTNLFEIADQTSGSLLRAAIDSSGNFRFNSGYGSAATAYGVRAWANFNGATSTIRASGNISSVVDISTGNASYRLNFTNALPNANYATSGSFYGYPSTNWTAYFSSVAQTTGYCDIRASGYVSVSGGYVVAEVANATGGSFTDVSVMIVR